MFHNLIEFNDIFSKIETLTVSQSINCISQNEIRLLTKLSDEEITMQELSKLLGITTGSTTVAVNKLVKKGFISRRKDNLDQRSVLIKLSKKGLLSKKFYNNFSKNLDDILFKNISKEQKEIFETILNQIIDNLKEYDKVFAPKLLTEFAQNDIVEIEYVIGKKNIQEYIRSLGIIPKSILKILKTEKYILVDLFKKKIKLSFEEANSIVAIKKYGEK